MTTANKLQRIVDTKADLQAEINDFLLEAEGFPMPDGLPFRDYADWLAYARGGDAPLSSILSMFANGENGQWWGDFEQLFTAPDGVIPTPVGGSVGLVLDQSQGNELGPELYPSGASGFADLTGIAGVNATVALSGLGVLITSTAANPGSARGEFAISGLTTGTTYLVAIEWVSVAKSSPTAQQGPASWTAFYTPQITQTGTLTCRVTASSGSGLIRMYSGVSSASVAGDAIRIDSISIRELPSIYNAAQISAAARWALGRAPVDVRNLLVDTENFEGTWAAINATKTGVEVLTLTATVNNGRISQSISQDATGKTLTLSAEIRSNTGSPVDGVLSISGAAPLAFVAGEEWVRYETTWVSTVAAAQIRVVVNLAGQSVQVRRPQMEIGETQTNYQRVTTRLDITETGVPSFRYMRPDLSDDVLPTVYPAGFTGDVVVCGRKGSWLQRGVTVAAGGSLNIGPNSITGAPAGLLAAIGDIVEGGVLAVSRTLTDAEIARHVAFCRAKGAKGLLVEGTELVVNGGFNDGATGWTITGGAWSIATGIATKNPIGSGDIQRAQTLGVSGSYIHRITYGAVRATNNVFVWANNTYLLTGSPATGVQTLIAQNAASDNFRLRGNGASDFDVSRYSVRRLIPQEDL